MKLAVVPAVVCWAVPRMALMKLVGPAVWRSVLLVSA